MELLKELQYYREGRSQGGAGVNTTSTESVSNDSSFRDEGRSDRAWKNHHLDSVCVGTMLTFRYLGIFVELLLQGEILGVFVGYGRYVIVDLTRVCSVNFGDAGFESVVLVWKL